MKKLLFFVFLMCSMNVSAQNGNEMNQSKTMMDQYHNNDSSNVNHGAKSGLKGFLEVGYAVGSGHYGEDRISFLATIGWQFSPYVFAGIGTGENYFANSKLYGIPLYGDLRVNILDKRITPFLETKIGSSTADVKGFFFSPSAGCRFGFKNNSAFTISLGFELQRAKCFINDNHQWRVNSYGETIKIGFDF